MNRSAWALMAFYAVIALGAVAGVVVAVQRRSAVSAVLAAAVAAWAIGRGRGIRG